MRTWAILTITCLPVFGGSITIGEYNFTRPAVGGPTFDANFNLTNVGNGLGAVGAQNAAQVFNGALPGVISGCATQAGGGGCLAVNNASFGAGAATMFTGNYFVGFYFSASDPVAADGGASIIYESTGGAVTFTNNTGSPLTGYAGAFLGILGGFGGQANAVVGAAIDGTISLNGGGANAINPVVLFGSSLPGQPTSVAGGVTGGSYYNCVAGFCNNFYAWGVSLINGGNQVTINANGGTLTVNGTLSVIADPMASIIFDLPTDPFLQIPEGTHLPSFGAATASPEPGTLAMLGLSLAALSLIRKRNR
jgi:PEP-CTERM motif